MLIEVLFVPGCPNHVPAVQRLRKVLRSEGINASIQEIPVTDELMASSLSFRVLQRYASMDAMSNRLPSNPTL